MKGQSKKTIFISRELSPDSILRTLETQWVDKSMIQILPVYIQNIPKVDVYFFYSKNGVKHFFDQINSMSFEGRKIAVIGQATADYLISHHHILPDFVGLGQPDEVAQQFKNYAKDLSVCFIQAQDSRSSATKFLSPNQYCVVVCYQSVLVKDISVEPCSIYVFTSPLNVDGFIASGNQILPSAEVISIGETTAKHIQQVLKRSSHLATQSSEAGILDVVNTLWTIN